MEITLLDDKYDPETSAMLQAFYSRNHKPIKERLSDLGEDQDKVKKNLEKWYVGYGHRSIGQCAGFTIFIEGVSILAAKAIQDSTQYNGQETSTRYIDFSTQEMVNPLNDKQAHDIQKTWLEFYTKNQEVVLNHVLSSFHLDKNDPIQLKTAKARTFDILRGFLPAGCKTQLSWFTTFDNAVERLVQLLFHPLHEVREIANSIIVDCKDKYPFAFSGIDKDIERYGHFYSENSEDLNYFCPDHEYVELFKEINRKKVPVEIYDTISCNIPDDYIDYDRPKGVKVEKGIKAYGTLDINYLLDYGSFRDIQRHRSCHQMIPVLTIEYGFNKWYLDQLPYNLRKEAKLLILKQELELQELYEEYLALDPEGFSLQYLVPLGYNVNCRLVGDLQSLVYISEIRTGKTVHPTLRIIAKEIANYIRGYVKIYDDQSEDELDLRRGTQDIVEK